MPVAIPQNVPTGAQQSSRRRTMTWLGTATMSSRMLPRNNQRVMRLTSASGSSALVARRKMTAHTSQNTSRGISPPKTVCQLSPGQAGDAPQGRELLRAGGPAPAGCHLIMDRAYEGDETRQLAEKMGYILVVPPKTNRLCPWEYDRVMYRRRNEIERLFRRLKGFRRVFSRFDKLDVMFAAFVLFALIVDALRFSVNTP